MDKQHAANTRLWREAWDHINRTGVASVKGNRCVYGGKGCAFAPAIKPECRDAADEAGSVGYWGGIGAEVLVEERSEFLHEWALDVDPEFAAEIQAAHDEAEGDPKLFLADFRVRMLEIANQYGIDTGGREDA